MQNLDVISVNIWQILISLINLGLLFFIIKKFLYKPVKNVLAARQAELEKHYTAAEQAEASANENRIKWEETMSGAKAKADEIMKTATENAKKRSDTIVTEAQSRANGIIRQAEEEAILERKKAADGIKREIVEVSGAISEKLLEREINTEDHRALIDSFIEKLENVNE